MAHLTFNEALSCDLSLGNIKAVNIGMKESLNQEIKNIEKNIYSNIEKIEHLILQLSNLHNPFITNETKNLFEFFNVETKYINELDGFLPKYIKSNFVEPIRNAIHLVQKDNISSYDKLFNLESKSYYLNNFYLQLLATVIHSLAKESNLLYVSEKK